MARIRAGSPSLAACVKSWSEPVSRAARALVTWSAMATVPMFRPLASLGTAASRLSTGRIRSTPCGAHSSSRLGFRPCHSASDWCAFGQEQHDTVGLRCRVRIEPRRRARLCFGEEEQEVAVSAEGDGVGRIVARPVVTSEQQGRAFKPVEQLSTPLAELLQGDTSDHRCTVGAAGSNERAGCRPIGEALSADGPLPAAAQTANIGGGTPRGGLNAMGRRNTFLIASLLVMIATLLGALLFTGPDGVTRPGAPAGYGGAAGGSEESERPLGEAGESRPTGCRRVARYAARRRCAGRGHHAHLDGGWSGCEPLRRDRWSERGARDDVR